MKLKKVWVGHLQNCDVIRYNVLLNTIMSSLLSELPEPKIGHNSYKDTYTSVATETRFLTISGQSYYIKTILQH